MPNKKKTATQGAAQKPGYADDIAKFFSGSQSVNPADAVFGHGRPTFDPSSLVNGGLGGGTGFGGGGGGVAGNASLDNLVDYAKKTDQENKLYLSNNVEPAIDALGDANAAANRGDQFTNLARYNTTAGTVGGMDAALAKMRATSDAYKGGQQQLNDSDLAALSKYQGQNAALMEALGRMGWTDAKSAGEGLDAQRDALAQYKGLIDPTVTAQERLMAEKARRTAEQQQRSARDAVMADLGARGLRSGGAELANMLGAQQQTGQDRVLADMATQANAVNRGMMALQGYGTVAGQMRNADDIFSMFNSQQGQLAKQWGEEQKAKLAEEGLTNTTAANKGIGERNDTTFKNEQGTNVADYQGAQDKQAEWDKYFNQLDVYNQNPVTRQTGLANQKMNLGQLWTGNALGSSGQVGDALKAKAGNEASAQATALLSKKSPLHYLNPMNW